MIEGFHHAAYRCRDSEATRAFYEDFLGCPLIAALPVSRTASGRPVRLLHTYFHLGDGTYIAFFEDRDRPFDFKPQHDFDLHVSFEVDEAMLTRAMEQARDRGIECRGITDHGFIRSVYLRDPNGYVVELTAKKEGHAAAMNPALNDARAKLERWQAGKQLA